MTTVLSDINSQRMLALVKAALHGTVPDENLFVDAAETDWNELFEQSNLQGVMVLSLNGAILLPKKLQPPPPLKLRWIASVETVEKWYWHCLETAKELSVRFKENNIRMLLFKGIALSKLYPVPGSRQFGDMDIFLCGKSKEGDAVLENIAKKYQVSKKHSNFFYKGIMIENHYTFLNQNSYKSFQYSENLEKQLLMILTEAGIMDINLAESVQTDEDLLFPTPDFDALFVTLHTFSHLPSRIVLRQLCDLTVIFTAYKGKIDISRYRNILAEAGLLKLADIFISLSVKYLGLNPEYAPPYESDCSLENRIWNDILNPEVPLLPKEKRTFLNVFTHKIKLLYSFYWKYELIFPRKYWKRVFYSTFFNLRHPEKIGKFYR